MRDRINSIYESNIIKVFAVWFATSSVFALNEYFYSSVFSDGKCWPFFEGCKEIVSLYPLPLSYSQSLIFMIVFSLCAYSMYALYNQNYVRVHVALAVILLFKYLILVFSGGMGNYDYYDIIIQTLFFLSLVNTVWLLRVSFCFLYFLAGTIKIHSGWIAGSYFSSLFLGLPLIPNIFIPFVTNLVILMQVGVPFLSFSKNVRLKNMSVWYILLFHLYSGLIVGYRYPVTSVSLVIVLFFLKDNLNVNNNYQDFKSQVILRKSNLLAIVFLVILLGLQLFPILFIKGDHRLTMEGNNYGLYMFEGNHQWISRVTSKDKILEEFATNDARKRFSISHELLSIQKKYCKQDVVLWTLDHSLNGGDFVRLVEVNPCIVSYSPFVHNDWIRSEDAKVIAKSKQNLYSSNTGKDAIFSDGEYTGSVNLQNFPGNTSTSIQDFILSNEKIILVVYWFLWIINLIFILFWIIKK